jgi:radical SAM protein with 4Fe4S-binding SPASM domain
MFRLSNLIQSTLEQTTPTRSLNGSIMIWNFTNRCNLLCHHCYSKADANEKDTLSFEQIEQTIPKLKRAGVNFVIFSGGEPLIRKDIFDIAKCMKENKIMTYLSTNGMYINDNNVQKIIDTFNYIGISIDGLEKQHDYFRGQNGSFAKSIEAIKRIQAHGGNAGIRFTLTKETEASFYDMFDLVEELNVNKFYISHLVYSGRGLDNLSIDISKEKRREYVEFIINKAFEYYEKGKNIDLVTGNMEMDAVMLLKTFENKHPTFAQALKKKLIAWGGNSAGNRLGNMDWLGNVKPDPFFPTTIGNYLQTDFDELWLDENNALLNKLRQSPRAIEGKCENCDYLNICNGGSRSRAYAISGNLWDEDPSCYLTLEEIKENHD